VIHNTKYRQCSANCVVNCQVCNGVPLVSWSDRFTRRGPTHHTCHEDCRLLSELRGAVKGYSAALDSAVSAEITRAWAELVCAYDALDRCP
jgi:hypothetical protein